MKKLVLLELNEINFDYLQRYIAMGHLPHFSELIRSHGYQTTLSEDSYEEIEPWIQWVSAHSGLPLCEHKIFRLGDIVDANVPQIWEELESKKGLSVGAVSPMNAANRLKNPAFFLPDPWTKTTASGSFLLGALAEALAQVVNDNAQAKVTFKSALVLLAGLGVYADKSRLAEYAGLIFKSKSRPWNKAILLDRFLADLFIKLWRNKKPDFSSLFLNAAAHIQHHYLFNSRFYPGPHKNPEWYAPSGEDPVLNIYQAYDGILGEFMRLEDGPRLMIATGLHQEPYPDLEYYYRLKDHRKFLKELDLPFKEVQPRMSRDFLVNFDSKENASQMEKRLKNIIDRSGKYLFEVDNRGKSLFVTLVYPHEIDTGFVAIDGGREIKNFDRYIVFVAIKNALHSGLGYFMDTAKKLDPASKPFFIWELKNKTIKAFEGFDE